jgi:hypothetical protein
MMPASPQPFETVDDEYRAIETTLLESTRGRWFLAEHGRRARRLDSALLEDAIQRLQSSLRQPPALLGQLQNEIETLRLELQAVRTALLASPATQSATDPQQASAIVEAAEENHRVAWALNANPFDPKGCETIARNSARLYALTQSQSVESGRILGFASSIDRIAARLDGLLETVAHEMTVDREG